MKLRNPWGVVQKGFNSTGRSREWQGKFSDKDKTSWTPELKKKLNFNPNSEDSVFYMPYDDFIENFPTLYICHYFDDYTLSTIPDVNSSKTVAVYQFNIKEEGEYYFGVSQVGIRSHPGAEYGVIGALVGRKDGEKWEFVSAKGGTATKSNWSMANCKPGKYIAMVTTTWKKKCINNEKFTFWIYGKQAIKIERVLKEKNLEKCQEFLAKMLINYVRLKILKLLRLKGRRMVGRTKEKEESIMDFLQLDSLSMLLRQMRIIMEMEQLEFSLKEVGSREVIYYFNFFLVFPPEGTEDVYGFSCPSDGVVNYKIGKNETKITVYKSLGGGGWSYSVDVY